MEEHHHPHGAAERLLHRLAVGAPKAVRDKDRRVTANKPSELEQQYQFAISGTAGASTTFAELFVHFTHAFYFAPANRDSGLAFPHFTFGSHTNPATGVFATVTEWLHEVDSEGNETNGAIVGAKVAVGCLGSGKFDGHVHLTFQGYGALIEPDEDALVNEG